METHASYTGKGGVGKSWTNTNTAASAKCAFPHLRIGILDACTDPGALSSDYAPQKEADLHGFWAIYHAMVDPMARRDPDNMRKAVRNAVTTIRVNPDRSGDEGSIMLINNSREFGRHYQGHEMFRNPDSYQTIGLPLLRAIEKELGLDILILDLPGNAVSKDALTQMLVPCATNICVPVDVRLTANMHGMDELVEDLRTKHDVNPVGFMANFAVDAEDCAKAQAELAVISKRTQVPILGAVRYLPSLTKVVAPCLWEGELATGLFIRMADKTINHSVRNVFEQAAITIDAVSSRLIA